MALRVRLRNLLEPESFVDVGRVAWLRRVLVRVTRPDELDTGPLNALRVAFVETTAST